MTRRQLEILDYVRGFIERRRYAPSIAEICRHFGLSSTATVHKHLRNLEERGIIRRDWNRSRSIEVLPERREEAAVRLPVAGELTIGSPLGHSARQDSVPVAAALVAEGRAHVLRVRGEGLVDQQIRDGDYLVCLETPTPPPGALVVAVVRRRQAWLARYHRDGGKIKLVTAPRPSPPLVLAPSLVRIQGLVVALVRQY